MVEAQRPYLGDQSRSPVVAASIASIACSFLAVGIIASYLPRSAPLEWPIASLIASVILLLAAMVFLTRRRAFAWRLFVNVVRWVAILPLVFAATAIFVFVSDGTRGTTLAIMTAVLILASINIPLVIGFSVVRHEQPEATSGSLRQ